jgi:TolB-like protein
VIFTNLSGDSKQDYFSDGITEDILTELSRARNLRVLARNTTFQYKGHLADINFDTEHVRDWLADVDVDAGEVRY